MLFSQYKKMKFSIKDFFSNCYQICSFQRIWSHLLKKSLMENFIFLCSASISLVCEISPWRSIRMVRMESMWETLWDI